MKNICIITARGGSKRIPKKNIKKFIDKPIIAYSIEAALGSGVFDRVIVSTDSDEIKEVSLKYGAEVPFVRSAKNSDDTATTADVVIECVEALELSQADTFCCLYPTAPFVTSERLKQASEKFKSSGATSLLPIVEFSFPPQRSFKVNDGFVSYTHPDLSLKRSQDLETKYHDTGQFYFGRVDTILKSRQMITDKCAYIVISSIEAQDIDTQDDWDVAEFKYRFLHKK